MASSSPFKNCVNVSETGESSPAENPKEETETLISTLPQECSWKVSENFYKYQGFWCYSKLLKGIILLQQNFIPQPTDIFLCTLPKNGTTWLKALAFAILTRTHYSDTDLNSHSNPLLAKMPHDIVPFLDYFYLLDSNGDPENPLISTHLPFPSLPESIVNSNSKIIYLFRDPKDVLVSMYHFVAKLSDLETIPFQEAYEKFCNGVSVYGPYWDHVLGYWKASLEFPDRIFFLKYEDLKNDTLFYVKKMADFMGCPFDMDEERHGIVEKIIKLCSFENLSNLEVNKSKNMSSNVPTKYENNAFFRKGKIGDWKNYLTAEMAERIDQITHQKFNGSGLYM